MITVKIGATTFICDTASEAVNIHRLVANVPVAAASPPTSVQPATITKRPVAGNSFATDFLDTIKRYGGHTLDSNKMKDILGIASVQGVGPRLNSVRKALEASKPQILLNDYLTTQKNKEGKTVWSVHVQPS